MENQEKYETASASLLFYTFIPSGPCLNSDHCENDLRIGMFTSKYESVIPICEQCFTRTGYNLKLSLDPKSLISYWEWIETSKVPDTPKPVGRPKKNEFWYYLVWSYSPSSSIEQVRKNISRFCKRKLGLFYVDISLEHGEKKGRLHYNMRVKSRSIIRAHIFDTYRKSGNIKFQIMHGTTEENWNAVGNYCQKEVPIEVILSVDK